MMGFRQARWDESLIMELSEPGKVGYLPPHSDAVDLSRLIPKSLLRDRLDLPEVSEIEVIRHFTRLSQENYGVDLGLYPLGSCTMKYNPRICEAVVRSHKLQDLHPEVDERFAQGTLQILYELSQSLVEVTGMDNVSLVPSAGAHGEFAGVLIMRAYHSRRGEGEKRTEIVVPDSAHGTNPASAAMAGYKVVEIPSASDGCIDLEALESALSERTAGFMLTNPNTIGVFEKNIVQIAKIVHGVGGLLYYDGANLNAIMGKARPGDMGFDIAHLNLHKTFSTPHGGGGPAAGPIGVKKALAEYLPIPTVEFDGTRYHLDYERPNSIGLIRSFFGNVAILVRAYAYILSLGAEGLERASELAVLNANYLARKITKEGGFSLPYAPDTPRKHESVLSAERLKKETGTGALEVSKRILDYGVHSPTMYFPLIVPEALMIEPTETASQRELDQYSSIVTDIAKAARSNPEGVAEAPRNTSVTRVDEVMGSHPKTLCLTWKMRKGQ